MKQGNTYMATSGEISNALQGNSLANPIDYGYFKTQMQITTTNLNTEYEALVSRIMLAIDPKRKGEVSPHCHRI